MIYILGGVLFIGFILYACCDVAHKADIQAERMYNEWKRKTNTKSK